MGHLSGASHAGGVLMVKGAGLSAGQDHRITARGPDPVAGAWGGSCPHVGQHTTTEPTSRGHVQFQNQIMKLENSLQDSKTIQNLKFNTETKLVRSGPCAWGELLAPYPSLPGPWLCGHSRARMSVCLAQAEFPGR